MQEDTEPTPVDPPTQLQNPKLDYSSARYGRGRPQGPGRTLEFTVGFVSYFAVIAGTYVIAADYLGRSIFTPWFALLPLSILIGVSVHLQGFRGWRGFVPGVMTGLGLSCLIGVGGFIWLVATCKPI